MNTKRQLLMVVGLICCLAAMEGCSKGQSGSMPEWVFRPAMTGKPGGVGISGPHVQGVSAQRNLAISRAVDEIASQMGVKVQNVLTTSTTASQDHSASRQQSYSIHTVDGQTIQAEIREIWHDSETNQLYVWMVTK